MYVCMYVCIFIYDTGYILYVYSYIDQSFTRNGNETVPHVLKTTNGLWDDNPVGIPTWLS